MRQLTNQLEGQSMPESARKCPMPESDSAPDILAERRRAAIEMLAGGQLIKRVAEALTVDPKTIYRWRQEPDFQAALSARIKEVWGEAVERMKSLAVPAVEILQRQLHSHNSDDCYRTAKFVIRLSGLERAMGRGG